MTAKLLFDECIGWPMVEQLRVLLDLTSESVELGHAVKMGFGGVDDEVWVPKIAGQGWVIISGDRGSRQRHSKGEKLPVVCRQFHVTHLLLSRAINRGTVFSKVRAIMSVWDDVLSTCNAPRGTGYSLRPSASGHPIIIQKTAPLSDPPPEPPKRQKSLLD